MSKYGVIGYANASGIGNLIYSFKEMLPEMTQLVVLYPKKDVVKYYFPEKNDKAVERKLLSVKDLEEWVEVSGIKLVFMIEYPYNWEFLPALKRMGIKTIMMPMFDSRSLSVFQYVKNIDFWIAPTNLTYNYIKSFTNNVCKVLPPINVKKFTYKQRGKGEGIFLHNGGYGGGLERKGTRLTCTAFQELRKIYSNLRLIVNLQTNLNYGDLYDGVELRVENVERAETLYEKGDVFVYPSKRDGIGLQILEAMACGFPVITTNYPPMNEFITCKKLLVNIKALPKEPFLHSGVEIVLDDLVEKMVYTACTDLSNVSEKNREYIERMHAYDVLRPLYRNLFEKIIKGI